MKIFSNVHYFNREETRKFFKFSDRLWFKRYSLLPMVLIEGEELYKVSDLERIKDLLDYRKYYSPAQMARALHTAVNDFRKRAHEKKIQIFVHPFYKRVLYLAADVEKLRLTPEEVARKAKYSTKDVGGLVK